MSSPKRGENCPRDLREEAFLMEQRDGVVERRMSGNGTAWEWLWRALSIVAIPWAAWFSMMLIDVRERVAVIEGNRFDSQQAYELMQIIDQKADRADVPPEWFREEVRQLRERLNRHEQRPEEQHP